MNAPELFSPSRDRGRVSGVVVGIVLDNKDQQELGRIKVRLPGLSDDEVGHWARVAVLMAGKERGTFFLPEKDDEVLVAFENGDITRPYIIGALWNGQDKPPDANADGKNNLRFIKSRSGHIVRLDDTDGAEKIEIIDKTGNNSVTFDTANNTITIKSAKDVIIEAPQGKISLSAKSIEVKSSAETKVEAQSTMDLKASATMNIKGATVNIN
ncbi:MAG: phage baseplate assembly protein V [Blastocatellia bacterium]